MPRQLLGTAIAANTITTTQLQTTVVNQISAGGGPRVTSLIYPGNDTAGNTVGGQTVYINGSGFETNNAIYINGNAVPSKSFISASNLSFTTPALSAGIYPVYVINTDSGATAIFVPGYIASAEPAWVTSAGSLNAAQDELAAWTYNLSATGDAPITYALAAGSSLPTGVSVAANGLISGTISSPTGNATTYTFSVVATDAQNQDSTRQFTVTTSTGEGVLFANNVLLIHADGTNNGNNHAFVDSSNNNFTITRNGNSTQGTFSPFSQTGWSNYFDGTGDYLTTTSSTAFSLGSGDFTIEAWANFNGTTDVNGDAILFIGDSTTNRPLSFYRAATNTFLLDLSTGGSNITQIQADGTIPSGVWMHFAATRSANTINIYFNGVLTKTQSYSSTLASYTGTVYIGRVPWNAPSGDFPGYISNLRVVKGTAVYTSNFTPPTTALTAIANTSLLTCQSNRFVDNSTNALTITRNGDVSIQAWSPFAPAAAYSTANVGGSGYFDGTGDYLAYASPSTNVRDWWTTDYTLEMWVYATTWTGWSVIDGGALISPGAFAHNVFNSTTYYWGFGPHSDGKLYFSYWNGSARQTVASTLTLTLGQWNHIAMTKTSSGITLFVNGIASSATALNGTPQSDAGTPINIGVANGAYVNGYISGLRVVKGTAVYTGNFTLPTAPVTAVSNTSFLINFTNAQIFDQTAKNVLETVGDAKVTTSQYKYGTGSIVFDGNGDGLFIPYNANLAMKGNYTIEFWMRFTSLSGYQTIYSFGYGISGDIILQTGNGDGKIIVYTGNPSAAIASDTGSTVNTNQWYHIAVVRNGSTVTIYRDGISVGSGSDTVSHNPSTATTLMIGGGSATGFNNFYFNGYLDDLRITKGYARYTSNFTPPTSALKDK